MSNNVHVGNCVWCRMTFLQRSLVILGILMALLGCASIFVIITPPELIHEWVSQRMAVMAWVGAMILMVLGVWTSLLVLQRVQSHLSKKNSCVCGSAISIFVLFMFGLIGVWVFVPEMDEDDYRRVIQATNNYPDLVEIYSVFYEDNKLTLWEGGVLEGVAGRREWEEQREIKRQRKEERFAKVKAKVMWQANVVEEVEQQGDRVE